MSRPPAAANGPRQSRNYRERGPKKFSYTYDIVAELVRRPVATVKGHAQRRGGNPGRFDPADLKSTLRYVAEALGWVPLSPAQARLVAKMKECGAWPE